MSTLGRKTPSIAGSRASVYSHASTTRSLRPGSKARVNNGKAFWYQKPLVQHAGCADLQRGAWHIGFYTLFLSCWTIFTSGFDIYCLDQAAPGSTHTGYYIFSFDFVYVGNPDVRNLLIMSAVFSMFGGIALFITSCRLLDALRKEEEHAFVAWLYTMGIFTIWKWIAYIYSIIVNDNIFAYNIVMLIAWFFFNIINIWCWICIYSLYLELNDLTKLQDIAKLKMNTMSSMPQSRATSAYGGSRPTSPYVNYTTRGGVEVHNGQQQQQQLLQQQQFDQPSGIYGQIGRGYGQPQPQSDYGYGGPSGQIRDF